MGMWRDAGCGMQDAGAGTARSLPNVKDLVGNGRGACTWTTLADPGSPASCSSQTCWHHRFWSRWDSRQWGGRMRLRCAYPEVRVNPAPMLVGFPDLP